MPVTPTYPGVYVEELPSGVHTITGVATSIAAFVGWAPKGPTDHAQLVLSWADFANQFGGLDYPNLLGYAVNHFFQNGGQQAYIVRLAFTDAAAASVTIGTAPNALTVTALNAGKWANDYQIATKKSTTATGRFQLQVIYAPTGATPAVVESFPNLSMTTPDPQGRYVVDVLATSSNLVSAKVSTGATAPPADGTQKLNSTTAGSDGTVLTPDTSNFETALQASGGTGGVNLLGSVDLFNLLCVPGETNSTVLGQLDAFCKTNRAFLIADSDPGITDFNSLSSGPGFRGRQLGILFSMAAGA